MARHFFRYQATDENYYGFWLLQRCVEEGVYAIPAIRYFHKLDTNSYIFDSGVARIISRLVYFDMQWNIPYATRVEGRFEVEYEGKGKVPRLNDLTITYINEKGTRIRAPALEDELNLPLFIDHRPTHIDVRATNFRETPDMKTSKQRESERIPDEHFFEYLTEYCLLPRVIKIIYATGCEADTKRVSFRIACPYGNCKESPTKLRSSCTIGKKLTEILLYDMQRLIHDVQSFQCPRIEQRGLFASEMKCDSDLDYFILLAIMRSNANEHQVGDDLDRKVWIVGDGSTLDVGKKNIMAQLESARKKIQLFDFYIPSIEELLER